MNDTLKSNSLVFAGPFLGELGWEISHWAPHVRWLRSHYKGHHIIAASSPGRHPLYYGFVNEFWPLPEWFMKERYEVDCFEALAPENIYGKLLKHFEDKYKEGGQFSSIVANRTPRGFNHQIRNMGHVLFDKPKPSAGAVNTCNELIQSFGNKPCVIIFAREVRRKMYLNIQTNAPEMVNPAMPLPSRNWPRSHWEDLFEMLYEEFKDQITFVIGGTKHGNCLLNLPAHRAKNVIDLTGIAVAHSLDITIAFLQRALCSISSQSGPTHLSLQTGCPSFIYGHEYERHAIHDNPLKTDVCFFETTLGGYNDSPDTLFHDARAYISGLMQEKYKVEEAEASPVPSKIELPIEVNFERKEKAGEIKKIGMIGVFDVKGSTNISFAKAFRDLNFQVEEYNYRSALERHGSNVRDRAIIDMSLNNDLLIFCKGNGIPPAVYKECAKNAIVCWYMMDAIEHLANQDFYEYAQHSHFSVVTTAAMKSVLEGRGIKNVHHHLQGVSPDEFYMPINFTNDDLFYQQDVVFIGTKSNKRDKIISKIKSWGYSTEVFGHGYQKFITGNEFNEACMRSKVCLAINNTSPDQDGFSDRILRYMATKSFIITEHSEGLERYFTNGEDLVWFKDIDELKRLLDNYLGNDELRVTTRKEIAEAGYKKVLENYTWKHVAEKIIQIAKGVTDGKEKIV